MHCICYICGIHYREKPPFDNEQITHGLCNPCFHVEMRRIKKITSSPRLLPTEGEGFVVSSAERKGERSSNT